MNSPVERSAPPSSTSPLPDRWTERLLDRLAAMYGQKFYEQWHNVDPQYLKTVWSEELVTYSLDEIRRGLAACRIRPWPPTLPEFLLLCRPPVDHEAAFIEAGKQMRLRDEGRDEWSHPAIYWAAVEFGTFELKHASWQQAKNRWTRLLDEKLAADLPAIPPRRDALPAPGKGTADPERVRQMIAELKRNLSEPMAERGR